jgi:hypothetical protein
MNNKLKWVLYIIFFPISLSVFEYKYVIKKWGDCFAQPRIFAILTVLSTWFLLAWITGMTTFIGALYAIFYFSFFILLISWIVGIVRKKRRKNDYLPVLISLILMFISAQFIPDDPVPAKTPKSTTEHVVYKVAKDDTTDYQTAKSKHAILVAKLSKLNHENKSLKTENTDDQTSIAESKQKQADQASEASVQKAEAESQSKAIEESTQKVASESRRQASSVARQQSEATSSEAKGDTYTGTAQDIIGNVNSKIYHVPGQSGYHMNSSNAVHFKSEAEAQAQGYRKALR